jgi:N,N'-diacetyllegionaminate synthase
MIIQDINSEKQLYFIVEEAQFNLGDFDKAIQMIELTSLTGADAIEFQLAYADDFYIRSEPGYDIYKTREFSDEQLQQLVLCAHENKLHFVATCLSYRLVHKMASFGADAFNINASDINNPSIVDAVVKTKKPFFVSMPLATTTEIQWVYNRILQQDPNACFAFLQGQHPMASGHEFVDLEDTALGVMQRIQHQYEQATGFIDHTPNLYTPAIAVAAGARIVTKHLNISHLIKGPDHQICLNPEQMKEAILLARKVYTSIRVTNKELAKGEDLDRSVMRRSIVSTKAIQQGEEFTMDNLEFKRPGIGIPPSLIHTVLGKTATQKIPADILLEQIMISK